MNYKVIINIPISNNEVPELREHIGWGRRDDDYPILFERCNFWAGVRGKNNKLIAFGYVCGKGLKHGYMEDIIVHPQYQGRGIGVELVKELLRESERFGLRIVTVSYEENKTSFYKAYGFNLVQEDYGNHRNKNSYLN
ncbi:ribosomal protein S18 acetylase RimI-like enzyme [Bacillus thermophilus]|uniref:Ribosomal protein S18 acetylase RimI-like enzyme n=1 Tax=Siminovitchia thermophila TaxID=1245522 RepID=A0ABS2R6L2_9BACI|nr:GNAT family N-acetyltransferase [Siminovitchia thermophila]MBM7715010.1 ribosomal protein S18 acetylase RimI-like enzyme [Siminovitchia thermophila]